MNAWSRRSLLLIAGGLLIVGVNCIVLLGVWWNRNGEPESQLLLTERELKLPYGGGFHKEDSGLRLRLLWRVPVHGGGSFQAGAGSGAPDWLDAAKLAELGFDAALGDGSPDKLRRLAGQQPREMLVVLEMAGSAWQRALENARQNLAHAEAARAQNGETKELVFRLEQARKALERENNSNSRLFAVDAGRDLAALRAKYPDRSRYLIVTGIVRPMAANHRLAGHLDKVLTDSINVPFELRTAIGPARLRSQGPGSTDEGAPGYTVRLAVGQRLVPWIVALSSPRAP